MARFGIAAAAAFGCCLGGCGSLLTFAGGAEGSGPPLEPRPFGGVRLDALAISKSCELELPMALAAGFFVLDLPLSLAVDILTLPVTIPLAASRESGPGAAPGAGRQESRSKWGVSSKERIREAP